MSYRGAGLLVVELFSRTALEKRLFGSGESRPSAFASYGRDRGERLYGEVGGDCSCVRKNVEGVNVVLGAKFHGLTTAATGDGW